MKKLILSGAILLLCGCAAQHLPSTVSLPYTDGNTSRPAINLTQVVRTDSTTEMTFTAVYDDYDIATIFDGDISLIAGDFSAPLKAIVPLGNTKMVNSAIIMRQGVPAQFKLTFPPLPDDVASVDLVQTNGGNLEDTRIWGIDLTGKRSPDEMPADIPQELLEFNLSSGNTPGVTYKNDTLRITAHAAAWRPWMNNSVRFYVNTVDDKQLVYNSEFNENGIAHINIPLTATAGISACTPYNTYSFFYADPGEDINLYILPINRSDAQRFIRPTGVTDGNHRNLAAMTQILLPSSIFVYSDTLLLDKTDTNEYFAAMMQIYRNDLDSIKAMKLAPDVERFARAILDRRLMSQTINPDAHTPRDWDERDAAMPDSVLRFSPDQVRQIRELIDPSNPLIELLSLRNPGQRTAFVKAKTLLQL